MYYNDSHKQFRLELRKFFAEEVLPFSDEWENIGHTPSKEIYRKMGNKGILACCVAPGIHLKNVKLPTNLDYKDFDYFHELIAH